MRFDWRRVCVCLVAACAAQSNEQPIWADDGTPPQQLREWFVPQKWQRDTDGPVVSLGKAGQFDDTHIFAPSVIRDGDRFLLWYCGSRGKVSERVFRLGLSISNDGRVFAKHQSNPVYGFADSKRSVLTPTVLQSANGNPIRHDGRLRMWFSSTDFKNGNGLHTLHESTSSDGIDWTPPSKPLLEHVYAPSVIRDGCRFRMWFVDVRAEPWVIKHASSTDGRSWDVDQKPCLIIDQKWEAKRLFYPTVLKIRGAYMMWYGSYWSANPSATATGFAASLDGRRWFKHPNNPVHRPDPAREWESNYVTSQSVMQLDNGDFRMWYASRKKPPFVNKYFAINTATWKRQ